MREKSKGTFTRQSTFYFSFIIYNDIIIRISFIPPTLTWDPITFLPRILSICYTR